MLPWSADLAGRIDEHVIDSELLRGNPLGDPHDRPLWVYLPPGYDSEPGRRYPSVYVIQGYTGHVAMWANRNALPAAVPGDRGCRVRPRRGAARGRRVRGRVDEVRRQPVRGLARHRPLPLVPVRRGGALRGRPVPDAARRGAPGDHGQVERRVRRHDHADAAARPVRHPRHACRDSLYELSYIPEFGKAARHLRGYDGDIWRWWADFTSRVSFTKEEDQVLLMTLGVAACFSAREDGTVELPFDTRTGELRPEIWRRWLDWDPVRMVPKYADALRAQRGIWIDAGTRDEWFLDLGAEAFRAALLENGVAEDGIRFELFEAPRGHRLPLPMSLAWLCQRMAD